MRRLLLAVWAPLAAAQPVPGADAVAFVRVIGDLRIESREAFRPPVERKDVELATGSGFLVTPSGLILTNHHVIAAPTAARLADPDSEVHTTIRRIEAVVGAGGTPLPAVVVAFDPVLDLALLSVTSGELPYLAFGDSDAAHPGEPTRVLGFPFGRQVEIARRGQALPSVTVSAGRVAANRADDQGETRFLQTDATINPGSSGGPMLDADGYAIGVVRLKLARGEGAGFAIPINQVKDFLEANGYLGQLPARRLRPLPAQTLDFKGLRLEAPERIDDDSRSRLKLRGGSRLEEGELIVDRVATAWKPAQLEEVLLEGGFDGFALERRPAWTAELPAGKKLLFGSATGTRDGVPLRVEYALASLGKEAIVARFIARPDQVAFNLSVVRRALASLEAEPLLRQEVTAPPAIELESATLKNPWAPPVPVPARFVRDETESAACPTQAVSTLSTSPAGDFTVVLRVGFFLRPDALVEEALQRCAAETESTRFGVVYRNASLLVRSDDGLVRFEAETPAAKWPLVEKLVRAWLARAAVR